uniref:Single-stranded DNA-binding protein n=2 Tax=Planobispora rosea TaxID=35762 RepID=Q2MLT4_PLARO|nr:putative single-strand DNA-binding protein [Planobispora rosea]
MAVNDMILTAVGNLTADPELRYTPNGQPVCQFSIAVNPRERTPDGTWKDGDPSYVRVQCWRSLAEHVAVSLRKGVRVIVTGRWREERWEKDGQKHSTWLLTADAIGPDLTFAPVEIKAANRRDQAPPEDPWVSASRTRPAAQARPAGAPGPEAGAHPAVPSRTGSADAPR